MSSDTPGDRSEEHNKEDGEEDTLAPQGLEKENSGRAEVAKTKVTVLIEKAEIKITDGGVDIEHLVDENHDESMALLFRAIILVVLVVLCLFLWRMGLVLRVLGMIP